MAIKNGAEPRRNRWSAILTRGRERVHACLTAAIVNCAYRGRKALWHYRAGAAAHSGFTYEVRSHHARTWPQARLCRRRACRLPRASMAPTLQAQPDFGDNTSQWANDGECDDPRFEGEGAAGHVARRRSRPRRRGLRQALQRRQHRASRGHREYRCCRPYRRRHRLRLARQRAEWAARRARRPALRGRRHGGDAARRRHVPRRDRLPDARRPEPHLTAQQQPRQRQRRSFAAAAWRKATKR